MHWPRYATPAGRAKPKEFGRISRSRHAQVGSQEYPEWFRAGLTAGALTAFLVVAPAGAAFAARGGAPLLAHAPWQIRKSPNATVAGGQLNAVSCSAATACTAVGTNLSPSGVNVTLAERWNGTSWHHQSTPNPPNDTVP